jgi:hypothetical protein
MSARGAQRRIQALISRGWSRGRLAVVLRVPEETLTALLHAQGITQRAHQAVDAAYARLWNVAPPQHTVAEQAECATAAAEAHAHGWMPPMAWDDIDNDPSPPLTLVENDYIDEVAVERALTGERIPLTIAERSVALRMLCDDGVTASRIAELLHMNTATARAQFDAYVATQAAA